MGDDKSPCAYGLWTNGLDMFFLHKEVQRFGAEFEPRADWPQAEASIGSRDVASHARLRRAEPERLRMAFRRCHNFIHGNEGMPKDAAFWQFLYLLFAKMHDEQVSDRPAASGASTPGLASPSIPIARRQSAPGSRTCSARSSAAIRCSGTPMS